MNLKGIAIWAVVAAVGAAASIVIFVQFGHWRPGLITIQGAVIRKDKDTRRELPVTGAVVTVSDGVTSSTTKSDASGFFRLSFQERVWPSEEVNLSFRDSDYHPLDLRFLVGLRSNLKKLTVAELEPVAQPSGAVGKLSVVSNIRIRYSVNYRAQTNIGTRVETFQVVNQGNVPCQQQYPCSPDGVWKASTGSTTLDAGADNEFRNVRASCFSGPCPFTRIDSSGYARGGRVITASALDWSDTATFLVEAEVFHDTTDSNVRESYPVIFGRVMHFTLPSNQEGVSIEAEIDGSPMVFPLGPDLYTSWATCSSRAGAEGENSTAYQCELKPGYRFTSNQSTASE
ncbi:MAG TPA: hypothetical protein VH308_12095 [Terracidiphilus sp.]|jgi:hypothetical protein|nr:hypothetical protein [Terracidiphilus sp.]